MQNSERDEFDRAMNQLCLAFDTPPTQARRDAYFTGLAKMSLAEFTRIVEYAIGPDGAEKFPSVRVLWNLRRDLRAVPALPQQPTESAHDRGPDKLAYFANRLLWRHVIERGGLGSVGRFEPGHGMVDCELTDELRAVIAFKIDLVAEFETYIRERDELATMSEFVRRWVAGIDAISPINGLHRVRWNQLIADPRGQKTFSMSMAN